MKRYTQPQIEKVELIAENLIATSPKANNGYASNPGAYSNGFKNNDDWSEEDEE